jgi:hypothetical protein
MKAGTGIMTGTEISGIRITTEVSLLISSKTGVNMQTGMRISGIATGAGMTVIREAIMEETDMEITETNA